MASGVLSPTSMRDNVAKEILESEKTFVEQMQTLVKVFSKPLKWWAQELSVNYGKNSMHPTLPENFLFEIFANIEQLLVFNTHIVSEFTEIYNTTKAFGAYFKKAAPFFKMYSAYVSNYDRAMETLNTLCDTRLDFASFVRACELQEPCRGLNLRSYLIMPVQRIPRYKMLLAELLKHTPTTHPDYQDLHAAVELVSKVVNSINEDIKRQERRFKVVEVQERFDTSLVTASRMFVKEGDLIKMCRKGPKRFFFVLFNDLLVYGSERMGVHGHYSLHRRIELNDVFMVDSGEEQRSFLVASRNKSFVVQCKDIVEKKDWLAALSSCFTDMDKSPVYRNAKASKDARIASIILWMVRDGKMVREMYMLPDSERLYGLLSFSQLRLVVDPQQVGPEPSGGIGSRVRNLFRGSSAQMKIGVESPVPCEQVAQVASEMPFDDDDASISTEATSDQRLSLDMRQENQADLLSLSEIYTSGHPPNPGPTPCNPLPESSALPISSTPTSTSTSTSTSAPTSTPARRGSASAQPPVVIQAGGSESASRNGSVSQQRPPSTRVDDLQQQNLSAFNAEAANCDPGTGAPSSGVAPRRKSTQGVSFGDAPREGEGRRQSLTREGQAQNPPPHHQPPPPRRTSLSSQQQAQQAQQTQQASGPGANPYAFPSAAPGSSIMDTLRDAPSMPPTSTQGTTGLNGTLGAGGEYVAVIPVTEMGLGLFLKDENGEVVIGGFRAPRSGMGINPSQKAGVKLGDVLVKVNGLSVGTVAQTIAALRESRMEQVIALTLRKANQNPASGTGTLRKSLRSPTRTFRGNGATPAGNARVPGS